MIKPIKYILFLLLPAILMLPSCHQDKSDFSKYVNAQHYLNLHDSVMYVGMDQCKECHYQIYETYIRTGMGLSFDTASPQKSAAVIGEDSILYDPYTDLYLKPFWSGDTMKVKEYRLENGQMVYDRTEKVDYVIGSGQHTNSHIYLSGDYAYQVPFTYYTQDGMFDLPPGFEDGNNSRFSRKIGLECLSCHNGFPDMVQGSENKYRSIPDGIDCERCHGPGEIHVMLKRKSILVDTARNTDYSIVNPAKLSSNLQTDLCARCHLQGTMVLREGKSFYDFKPGMELSTVLDIFMPLHVGGKEDFIMASHYERMAQSKCYISSDMELTCTSCHNPHFPRNETSDKRYINACLTCHSGDYNQCSATQALRKSENDNCIVCHMRESGSRDIPHVRIHDHKISIPLTEAQLQEERIFKGLISINNPGTDHLTKARGYLLEYETYHPDPNYLDSAAYYLDLSGNKDEQYFFNASVNLHFLRNDFNQLINDIEIKGIREVLNNYLTEKDYSNYDAWTAYRIGQAYDISGSRLLSGYFYEKAVELAPYNLEFRNKLGYSYYLEGDIQKAGQQFQFILDEDPRYASAYVNLGFIWAKRNNPDKAKDYYNKALQLDPDNIQALVNLAAIYALLNQPDKAGSLIYRAEEIDPDNHQLKQLKAQMENNK